MNQLKKRASSEIDLHQKYAGARLEPSEIVGEEEDHLMAQGTTHSRKKMLQHLEGEGGRSCQSLVIFSGLTVLLMEEGTAAIAINNKHSNIDSHRVRR